MSASPPKRAPVKAKERKGGKPKREKIFHPESRKAHQVERTLSRKHKMTDAKSKRARKASSESDKFAFFFHALPPLDDPATAPDGTITLPDVHALVRDVWLPRHDPALAAERAARRPGRPPSTAEQHLALRKQQEAEEYRTGLEVPDLTHPVNVKLFREWDQVALEYIDLLRFIRISSESPDALVVARPGKHHTLVQDKDSMDTT